jgi:4'-phosphopantetheinyl transferase
MERHISISHTDAVVAAAVSAIGPVGIDIERRNPARDVVSLAEVAFGPAEAAAVEVEGIAAFYRIWTVREAISKATGEGLAAVADKSDRVPIRMADGTWTLCQGNYLVAHDLIYEEVSLALAVQLLSNDAAEAMRETHVARSRVRVEQSKRTS